MNYSSQLGDNARPLEWPLTQLLPRIDQGLARSRLQTAFGKVNAARSALKLIIVPLLRQLPSLIGGERTHGEAGVLHLRRAHAHLEAALEELADCTGGDTGIVADRLPDGPQEGLPF